MTESSAVFVAVRVRPFTAKEEPYTCTVQVPDDTTITLTDVAMLSSASPLNHNNHNTHNNASGNTAAGSAFSDRHGGPVKRSYTFDKIFWSVPPAVLPLTAVPQTARNTSYNNAAPESPSKRSGRTGSFASTVQHDKGKVGAMASPPPPPEDAHCGASPPLSPQGSQFAMTPLINRNNRALPCYAAVPAYDDQADVYNYLGPRLTTSVMAGYNACLLAYGQTGSGKSYSIMGPPEFHLSGGKAGKPHKRPDVGIIPRLIEDIFSLMRSEREKDETVSYSLEMSFMEIYCEKVRDLLSTSTPSSSGGGGGASSPATDHNASALSSLRVRQHPTRGPYVEGLSHRRVRDTESVIKYVIAGLRERATAGTNMNEHSSRSHAILQLQLTRIMVTTEGNGIVTKSRTSKANLVDLAGSERVLQSGATGDRFEEARNINLSLTTLGRVIHQLSEKQLGKNVIPAYRDSSLTWLLADSLGGNSKTILLATVAPSAYCYGQTLNTLRFAGVAKKVINVASVNEDSQFQQVIAELRQKIVRLTLQLEKGKASEVHLQEIATLRADKAELVEINNTLRARSMHLVEQSVVDHLKRRSAELEEENTLLRSDKVNAQQRYLVHMTGLRQELAESREEVLKLQEQCTTKDAEASAWSAKYLSLQPQQQQLQEQQQQDGKGEGAISKRRAANNNNITIGKSVGTSTPSAWGAPTSIEGGVTFYADSTALRLMQKLKEDLAKAKQQARRVQKEQKAAEARVEESKDSAAVALAETHDFRMRCEDATRQKDLLQRRLETAAANYERAQCELAALRSGGHVAPTAQESSQAELSTQLANMRDTYLNEKQDNIELLLRSSKLEQERGQLRKWAAEKLADTAELEQLLVEEAETSARYYMRMRYYRTVSEIQQYFTNMMSFSFMCSSNNRATGGFLMTPPDALALEQQRPTAVLEGNALTVARTDAPSMMSIIDLLQQPVRQYQDSMDLIYEYECINKEAHARSAIEVECLTATLRLCAQRDHLRVDTYAAVHDQLLVSQEQLNSAVEELAFHRKHARETELRLQQADSDRQEAKERVRQREEETVRVHAQLRAVEEQLAEQERTTESLIGKLADVQNAHDALHERCLLAERAAAYDADDTDGITDSGTLSQVQIQQTSDAAAEQQPHQQQQQVSLLLHMKQMELQAVQAESDKYQAERDALSAEVGALSSQLQLALTERTEQAEALQANKAFMTQQQDVLKKERSALHREMDAVRSDCEARIAQQQSMVTALRKALEDESQLADRNRETAKRVEANAQRTAASMTTLMETHQDLHAQQELTEERLSKAQAELRELRATHAAVEKQLNELRRREPGLFVLIQRGIAEDSTSWIEKVRREKERMEWQRAEAHQLNKDLLDHVKARNARLRDVEQQLHDLAVETTAVTTPRTESSAVTFGANSRVLFGDPLGLGDNSFGTDDSFIVAEAADFGAEGEPSTITYSSTSSPSSPPKLF